MFCKEIKRIYKPTIFWNGFQWIGKYDDSASGDRLMVIAYNKQVTMYSLIKIMNKSLVRKWKLRY